MKKKKKETKDDVEKQHLKFKKIKSEVIVESYPTGFSEKMMLLLKHKYVNTYTI